VSRAADLTSTTCWMLVELRWCMHSVERRDVCLYVTMNWSQRQSSKTGRLTAAT